MPVSPFTACFRRHTRLTWLLGTSVLLTSGNWWNDSASPSSWRSRTHLKHKSFAIGSGRRRPTCSVRAPRLSRHSYNAWAEWLGWTSRQRVFRSNLSADTWNRFERTTSSAGGRLPRFRQSSTMARRPLPANGRSPRPVGSATYEHLQLFQDRTTPASVAPPASSLSSAAAVAASPQRTLNERQSSGAVTFGLLVASLLYQPTRTGRNQVGAASYTGLAIPMERSITSALPVRRRTVLESELG